MAGAGKLVAVVVVGLLVGIGIGYAAWGASAPQAAAETAQLTNRLKATESELAKLKTDLTKANVELEKTQGQLKALTKEPVKIGVSLPLTGGFAEPGKLALETYELWRDWINERGGLLGRPVQLVVIDSASDATRATGNVERLVTVDKVNLLFGTYASPLVLAESAVSEKYKMVYIVQAGGARPIWTRGFKYIFQGQAALVREQVDPFFDYIDTLAADKKPSKVAITMLDSIVNVDVATRAKELAEARKMSVVMFEKYPRGTTEFAGIAAKVKASGGDFWVASTIFEDAVGLTRAAKEVDYNPKAIWMFQAPTQFEFIQAVGKLSEKIFSAGSWHENLDTPGNKEFKALFKKKYNKDPSDENANAWVVAQILTQAVTATGSFDNTVIRDYLSKAAVQTIAGIRKYDAKGLPIGGRFIQFQIINGKIELVWPREIATATPVWPRPAWAQLSAEPSVSVVLSIPVSRYD